MIEGDRTQRGMLIMQVLFFSALAIVILAALASWAVANLRASRIAFQREVAIQIAEAGVDYYRWHLAHDQDDYQDGTGAAGPYVHNVTNAAGQVIGNYSLVITPPPSGSTIVTIESTGTNAASPGISRTIETKLAIPSFAKYAVVASDMMRFGEGTEVYGPIHSNGGIRFDGLAHNLITSAVASYNDPDHSGSNEYGVHTHVSPTDPLPPTAVPARTDVFEVGRQFPTPAVDFVGITTDLAEMKATAQAASRYYAPSGALGYLITLKTNDTFDLRRVNTLRSAPSSCTNTATQTGWGTWSIATAGSATTLIGTYSIPTNGVIFVEDNLWVQGQINTARVTIASGKFPDNPATRTSITVNNDLLYTNYDGQDVIALIAQNNFNVGLFSEDDLRIDAAIIAQNGRAGRFYYEDDCSPNHVRDTLTLYGMIGTAIRYGFAYTDDTGYENRNLTYDGNLLYGPPPSFPLTSDQYQTISWEELE